MLRFDNKSNTVELRCDHGNATAFKFDQGLITHLFKAKEDIIHPIIANDEVEFLAYMATILLHFFFDDLEDIIHIMDQLAVDKIGVFFYITVGGRNDLILALAFIIFYMIINVTSGMCVMLQRINMAIFG